MIVTGPDVRTVNGFLKDVGPGTRKAAAALWRREQKLAPETPTVFDDLHVHDLRHTAISLMCRAGYRPEWVAERVGHSDGGALIHRNYRHLYPNEMMSVAPHLDALISGEASTPGNSFGPHFHAPMDRADAGNPLYPCGLECWRPPGWTRQPTTLSVITSRMLSPSELPGIARPGIVALQARNAGSLHSGACRALPAKRSARPCSPETDHAARFCGPRHAAVFLQHGAITAIRAFLQAAAAVLLVMTERSSTEIREPAHAIPARTYAFARTQPPSGPQPAEARDRPSGVGGVRSLRRARSRITSDDRRARRQATVVASDSASRSSRRLPGG